MLSSTKSRNSGTRSLVLSVLLLTVFFSYTVVAQEFGSSKKGWEVFLPERNQKPVLESRIKSNYYTGANELSGFLDTLYVPTDYTTIQAAINAALDGNLVIVEEGTYLENIDYIGKAITVASRFFLDGNETHIDNTTIDGSQPNHPDSGSVVFFQSGEDTNSVLYGFTITGGTGSFYDVIGRGGGGIFCSYSGAKIIHNIIENNHVTSNTLITLGGGISAAPPNNSWVVIENNTIRNNSVTNTAADSRAEGGGIDAWQNARIINNIIEFNISQATLGDAWSGGVDLSSIGDPLVRTCIGNKIWNNKALATTGIYINGGVGGGLSVSGGPSAEIRLNDIRYNKVEGNLSSGNISFSAGVFLQNQTSETIFAQNYVVFNAVTNNCICFGAGLATWNYDVSGGPQIINNIISYNTGGTWGGGMFTGGIVYNDATFINNTICNNSANLGGGIYIGYDELNPSDPKIINSILWNNSSSIYKTTNSSDSVRYSDIQGGYAGEGNIDADPFFADTLFHLTNYFSPCLEVGIDSIKIGGVMYYCPQFDYEGLPRPAPTFSEPDMGACENQIPVPVELTSFTTTAQNDFVELNWTTATEINNQGFEVQRSTSNSEFVAVGFVEGNGTTTEEHQYSYKDKDVSGFLGYRLKQVDFDGSYEYSDIVEVEVLGIVSYELEQNYPNPFNPATTINYRLPQTGHVTLKIYDILGREVSTLVNEQKKQGRYSVNFDASHLASGLYIYQIRINDYVNSKKMLLLK